MIIVRIPLRAVVLCLAATLLVAQGDRGTLTGMVTDPAEVVVSAGKITVKNPQTAALFNAFNRVTLPAPSSANPGITPSFDSTGMQTGGYGFINAINGINGERTRQLVAHSVLAEEYKCEPTRYGGPPAGWRL